MLFQIHKWIGLVAAVYIVVISVSGVAIVFHHELGDLLCPLPKVVVRDQKIPLNKIIENLERSAPGYKVTGLLLPPESQRPMDVYMSQGDGKWLDCLIDPYTGQNFGLRKKNKVLEFIRDLHFNLLLGQPGRIANGIGGICFLALSISGVVLALVRYPKSLLAFTRQTFKKGKQNDRSVHITLGNFVLLFLIVQSVSGIYFGFPKIFQSGVNIFAPVSALRPSIEPNSVNQFDESKSHQSKKRIDQLVDKAKSRVGNNAVVDRIAFPDNSNNSVQIWLKDSPSSRSKNSLTKVCLSPTTGEVVFFAPSGNAPMGDMILQWLSDFHFGTLFDFTSTCAWVVLGLLPIILVQTGINMFLIQRRNF